MLDKPTNAQNLRNDVENLVLPHNEVVAFDFDELVVGPSSGKGVHLTRRVMELMSRPMTDVDKKYLEEVGFCSFDGISHLQSMAYGKAYEVLVSVCDEQARKVPWRDDFDKLLRELSVLFSVIFISSGVKEVCKAKLKEIDFLGANIIATEFGSNSSGILIDNRVVVSEEDKGEIVSQLRRNGKKVVAVGHSLGDKSMLDASDFPISYREDTKDLSQNKATNIAELHKMIMNFFI